MNRLDQLEAERRRSRFGIVPSTEVYAMLDELERRTDGMETEDLFLVARDLAKARADREGRQPTRRELEILVAKILADRPGRPS